MYLEKIDKWIFGLLAFFTVYLIAQIIRVWV